MSLDELGLESNDRWLNSYCVVSFLGKGANIGINIDIILRVNLPILAPLPKKPTTQ